MPYNLLKRPLPYILSLCLFIVALIIPDLWRQPRLAGEQEVISELPPRITADTVLRCQTYHSLCGHTTEENPADNSAFMGMGSDDLTAQGWQAQWQGEQLYLSRESGDFCPLDAQKRHLRLINQQLAIYAGPLLGGGELLRVLETPLYAIPVRWLAQLTSVGIEFKDEETLLMALDSLDEAVDILP